MAKECLNLPKGSANDETTKTNSCQKYGRKLYKLFLLSIGLLCILQTTLHISVRLYQSGQWDQLHTDYNNLSKERDRLQTSYNQLLTSYNNLTIERDHLKTSYNQLLDAYGKDKMCSVSESCPVGWLVFDGSCYYVSNEAKNWDESRQDCLRREADLVIINSKQEQRFLANLDENVWLGLTDIDEEGAWKWVDGTPLNITNSYWYFGQPDNGGRRRRGEDCAYLLYGGKPCFIWKDIPCTSLRHWLCEKKMAPL